MNEFGVYCLPEEMAGEDFVIATYYCEFEPGVDIVAREGSFAVGQTIGTWVAVPGVTNEMRARHMGRVANITDIPPAELSGQVRADTPRAWLIDIAFPVANFGADFAMMLTTLLGNDASTSAQARLIDLRIPQRLAGAFGGPRLGIEGVRRMTGIADSPVLMSMLKPCTGMTPEAGAEIFFNAAIGGLDVVKDDELLGDTEFSRVRDRVKAYNAAADRVFEATGKRPLYIVNITGPANKLEDRADIAIDAGAKGVMASCAAVGYSAYRGLADHLKGVDVLLMGHYAGTGMYYEGARSGMGSHLAAGRFPRLAGADLMMINTPFGGYPLLYEKYIKTAHHLTLPFYDLKSTMPVIGGGVHPGLTERFMADLGKDIMLASGGAVHGHPMGPAAGAKAMRQSIDAVMQGIPLADAAKELPELAAALELWG